MVDNLIFIEYKDEIDLYENTPPSAQISADRMNLNCMNDTVSFVDHSAVRAGNAAGSGGSEQSIFAGRTRLRELFGTTAATADTITTFYNGGESQSKQLFAVRNPLGTQTLINPASAHGGILADEGLSVDMPANSFVSLTVYYDG